MGHETNQQNAMASSNGRPLRLSVRKDLHAECQTYQGRNYWVVKDPLSLKYYRFEVEEYALLQMLDGQTSPCLLYTSPSPRDLSTSRMPSSA